MLLLNFGTPNRERRQESMGVTGWRDRPGAAHPLRTQTNFMDIRWDANTIISVSDFCNQEVAVSGKVWRFDYCRRLGPLWLRKDGTERKCQNPHSAVWKAFETWLELNTN